MVEYIPVVEGWYQVLQDGQQIGDVSQADDTTWTVRIWSMYPSEGHLTFDGVREYMAWLQQ